MNQERCAKAILKLFNNMSNCKPAQRTADQSIHITETTNDDELDHNILYRQKTNSLIYLMTDHLTSNATWRLFLVHETTYGSGNFQSFKVQ